MDMKVVVLVLTKIPVFIRNILILIMLLVVFSAPLNWETIHLLAWNVFLAVVFHRITVVVDQRQKGIPFPQVDDWCW